MELVTEAGSGRAEAFPGLPDAIQCRLPVFIALCITLLDIGRGWRGTCSGHGRPVVTSTSLVVAERPLAVSSATMQFLLDVLLILLLDQLVHFFQGWCFLVDVMNVDVYRGIASSLVRRGARLLPRVHAADSVVILRRWFVVGLLDPVAMGVVTRLPLLLNCATLVRWRYDFLRL